MPRSLIVRSLVSVALLVLFVAAAGGQLRTDVEAYLKSLKAAFDSGDRNRVLSHFEHGDIVAPTDSEYDMLRHIRFWEKPVKEIQTAEGVIRVTFTMDPESDSPAQFLTLQIIRGADGKLLIKSSATAADLEAAKERKKKQAAAEGQIAALARDLQGRKKIEQWPLNARFLEAIKERNVQIPPEVGPFPLAEIYRGNDAVLLAGVGEDDELRDMQLTFARKDGTWIPTDRVDDEAASRLLQGPPADLKIVRRQAGIPLE